MPKNHITDKLIVSLLDLNHIMRGLYEGKASQQRVLIILDEVKSITQRDLTAWLNIQPGSASEILSKLENAGLLMRTMSDEDRRTTNITLTEEGERRAREAAEQRSRRHLEMFSCLSEEEKDQLLGLLEKIRNDWLQRYKPFKGGQRRRCHHRHKDERPERGGELHVEVH